MDDDLQMSAVGTVSARGLKLTYLDCNVNCGNPLNSRRCLNKSELYVQQIVGKPGSASVTICPRRTGRLHKKLGTKQLRIISEPLSKSIVQLLGSEHV